MKQLVVLMLVAALAVPALADVAVTAADLGSGLLEVTVTPTGTAAVRGVALVLENANGATVASTSAVTATQLNTFIDYGFSVPAGFNVNVGHPAAKWNAAGVAVFPADSAKFAVCAGYLAPSGQVGLTVASKFRVQYTLSGNATIGISLDTLRGGIVGDNIGTITVQPTQVLVGAVATCRSLLTTTQQALFDRYVTASKNPNVWCSYQYQCRGDADNLEQGTLTKVRVGSNDLTVLLNSWNKRPETGADPRADFDRAEQGTLTKVSTGSNDLTILLNHWNFRTNQLTGCSTYLP